MTIAPVRRAVRTRAAPARAFEIFTSQMGLWWPKGRTVGAKPHEALVIEPGVGGRWFERDADGVETLWGKVLEWAPPTRLVLAWQFDADHRYDPDLITEVEIVFTPAPGGGTEVVLEHRNLERFRKDADVWAGSIARGWTEMMDIFAAFANRPDDTT
jgi:uncharacterized protein YndB with AHSA1/START domain